MLVLEMRLRRLSTLMSADEFDAGDGSTIESSGVKDFETVDD